MELKTGMDWPPKEWAEALDAVAHDKAWLTGGVAQRRSAANAPQPVMHPTQFNGGVVGATSRAILGKPNRRGSSAKPRHLPVAAELAGTVADLLFGNTPRITADERDGEQVAEAIQEYTERPVFAARLVEAGKACSATGWRFWRIRWNQELDNHPWVEWLPADKGFASFADEKLTEVTFVDEYRLSEKDKTVYRMTETHKRGSIEYILWKGTTGQLGMSVPFTEIEQTAYLADVLTEHPTIMQTNSPHMTAGMVINRATNPAWESKPHLHMYGHSDIQFGGDIWHDIDDAYTELWHEIESARSRLLVSESLLETGAPGSGSAFDWMRDVFPLGDMASADDPGKIEAVQFQLRINEYLQALKFVTLQAVGHFGLSPMSFGMDETATGDMTAREVSMRMKKSVDSWRARSRYWRVGLQDALTSWAYMDALLNGYKPPKYPVNVSMVEPIQDSDADRAATAAEWKNSESASIRTRVRHLHPEWGDTEIDAEVAALEKELGIGRQADNPFLLAPDEPIE